MECSSSQKRNGKTDYAPSTSTSESLDIGGGNDAIKTKEHKKPKEMFKKI